MAKIIVESDCLDILQRIKEVDSSYYIIFNTKSKKYEVHSNDQAFSSYCFTSPYAFLDERLVDYALKTRRQNKDKLIAEMEKENQKLIKNQQKKQKQLIFEEIEKNGEKYDS